MRPIDKGNIPKIEGIDKAVADYKEWRGDLLSRIGNYCSYCNMPLHDIPQVEHVIPKNPKAGIKKGSLLAWDNMLLACGACNRAKSNKSISKESHYIPDINNTHLIYDYVVRFINHLKKGTQIVCIPFPKKNLTEQQKAKAQNTIELLKLNESSYNNKTTDLRSKFRFETWYLANSLWRTAWNNWGSQKANNFIPLLIEMAKSKGFFSIWYDAFKDVSEIKKALIDGFLGTDLKSFQSFSPFDAIPRNPENILDNI